VSACHGCAASEPSAAGDAFQRPLRSRFQPRLTLSVLAPRKAWHLLQGESPCRVRASHPPVSSLASMAAAVQLVSAGAGSLPRPASGRWPQTRVFLQSR